MFRSIVSKFFLLIFLAFLTAPTIITVIDDTYDVSVFYNINEEENNNLNEIKKMEFHLEDDFFLSFFEPIKSNQVSDFYSNLYTHLKIDNLSPPPEQNIL